MTTPAYNCILAHQIWSDVGVLYTPSLNSGQWQGSLPLTNLQEPHLQATVARSLSAANQDTRFRLDLKTDRLPKVIAIPKHTVSGVGKIRVLGVPSTMLFDYEAGDDIAALGGTFARVPTTDNPKSASYIDSAGVLRWAGENLMLQSAAFDSGSWSNSNVTVAPNSIVAPDGTLTADTLTASAGNGTLHQGHALISAAFTFSVWLKRKTGSGNVQLTLDDSAFTTVVVTTSWQRFQITSTLANPDAGLRVVTNGDAVYAWGAQLEHGTMASPYVPTLAATCGAIRDGHFLSGIRTTLFEGGRLNSAVRSQEWDDVAWTKSNATVSANATTAPDGTLTADKLVEAASNTVHEIYQAFTITIATKQAMSFYAKAAERMWVAFSSRSTGISYVNLSTGALGTIASGFTVRTIALANGWYRIEVEETSNGVLGYIDISTATGDGVNSYAGDGASGIYLWGAQFEIDQPNVSSYIPTTTAAVARATEDLFFPFAALPQALTLHVKTVDQGNVAAQGELVHIGNNATPEMTVDVSGGRYRLFHHNGSTAVTSQPAAGPVFGDVVEFRGTADATGAVTAAQSLNGAAENVGATSGANTFAGGWSNTIIRIGSGGAGAGVGFNAFVSVRITAAVQTQSFMRSIVYDSGWQNQYPAGQTAETLNGVNVCHRLIIPTTQTPFRYVSTQIDDTSNATGYIDLARFVVAGGWQPSINMAYGHKLGVETRTIVDEGDSGSEYFNEMPTRRTQVFTIADIDANEALANGFDMQRVNGVSRQLFFVFDPTDTTNAFRRDMLCRMRKLTALEYPFYNANNVPYELSEIL